MGLPPRQQSLREPLGPPLILLVPEQATYQYLNTLYVMLEGAYLRLDYETVRIEHETARSPAYWWAVPRQKLARSGSFHTCQ